MKKIVSLYLIIGCVLAYGMGFSEETPKVGVFFIEIIIKVEPDVITMPEGRSTAPIDEIEITSEGIRELNKRFNLISMERVYAKEAPKELENTFLLKFPELIDPHEIISEYEKLEDVIYAEENVTVGIF